MKKEKVFRVFIALLFLISGFLKAVDSLSFVHTLSDYGISSKFGNYIAPLITGFEIFIGVSWLMSFYTRKLSLITLVFTGILTIILLYGFQAKGITDCGCFGEFVKIPVWLSFLRNGIIILISFFIWKQSSIDKKPLDWKYFLILLVCCLGFLTAGISTGTSLVNKNKIYVGQHIKDTFLNQFEGKLYAKKGFIFVFSPSCSHCWNASENVKSIKEQSEFENLIGVISSNADIASYVEQVKPNFEIFEDKTGMLSDFIKEVPVLIELDNGQIRKIYDGGDIPSGAYLRIFNH